MKKNAKTTLRLTAAALAASAGIASTPANAMTVWDPGVNATIIATQAANVTAIGSVTAAVTAGFSTLMLDMRAQLEPLLAKITLLQETQMQNAKSQQGELIEANYGQARQQMKTQRAMERLPSQASCEDISMGTGRSAAAAGSAANKAAATQSLAKRALSAPTAAAQGGEIRANHSPSNGYCRASDITFSDGSARNLQGCSAVGKMPGADLNVASILAPAASPTSLTYNQGRASAPAGQDEDKAAMDAIGNLTASSMPRTISKKAQDTDQGRNYTANAMRLEARVSAANSPLLSIYASRKASVDLMNMAKAGDSSGASFADSWGSGQFKTIYNRLFKAAPPDVPSEAELTRYEVMRRYADTGDGSWNKKLATMPDSDVLKEMARNSSIQLYLTQKQNERLDEIALQLSALLMQQISPVSKDMVDALANTAEGVGGLK